MPPPARRPLNLRQSVTLDGAGGGTVVFGPPEIGDAWEIQFLTVGIGGGVALNPDATAYVYIGPRPVTASPEFFRLKSEVGALDAAGGPPPYVLGPGDQLMIEWLDGAVTGVVATGTLQGRYVAEADAAAESAA